MNRLTTSTITLSTLTAILAGIAVSVTPFFFGGHYPAGRIILFLCAGFALLLAIKDGLRIIRLSWWKNPDVWFLAFLLVSAASFFITRSPLVTRDAFADILVWWAFFVAGRAIRSSHDRSLFIGFLLVGTFVLSVWSLVAHFTYDIPLTRTYGPFRNSDGLGPSLLIPMVTAWALVWMVRRPWIRVFAFCNAFILTGTLVLTSSVSAGAGIVIAGILGLVLLRPRVRFRTVSFALLVFMFAIGSAFAFRALQAKQANPDAASFASVQEFTGVGAASSFSQRWRFIRSSLAMAAAAPLTGQGLGMWNAYFTQFQRSVVDRTGLAHGLVPQFLGELGWPGLVVWTGVLASTILCAFRSAQRHNTTFLTAGAIGLAALAVAGSIDIPWFYPSITGTFWLLAGMTVAPLTDEPVPKKQQRIVSATATLIAIVLIFFGVIRFMSSTLTAQAEQAGNRKDWIDAYATAGLALRMLPNHEEELRIMFLLNFNKRLPNEKEDAKRVTERVLRRNPLQPAAYLQRGTIAREEGDLSAAESFYREGLRIDPFFTPNLSVELAKLLIAQKQFAEGKAVALRALAETSGNLPNGNQSLSVLAEAAGVAELFLGERDAAKQHIEEALRLDPENANARTIFEKEFPS